MRFHFLFFALLVIFQLSAADQVYDLQSLPGGTKPYKANDFEFVKVFASASIDDDALLKQILLTNGYGDTKTVLDLKKDKIFANADLKNGWITKGPIMVSTPLGYPDIRKLRGLIYFRQLFRNVVDHSMVYDITGWNTIQLQKTTNYDQTVIFLNTFEDHSTEFVYWSQGPSDSAVIYSGANTDTPSTLSTIFKNPFSIDGISKPYFSASVEPFSLNLPYFSAVFNGGVQLAVNRGKVDLTNYTTSKVTTTGLIAKTYYEQNFNAKIKFPKGAVGTGVSGFNAVGSISHNTITFDLVSSGVHNPTQLGTIGGIQKSQKRLADTFEVTPRTSYFYYAQYYNIEDSASIQ